MIERLNYIAINGPAIQAMFAAKSKMTSIDVGLRALVELRVSQINGCAYCIDVHGKEAVDAGEGPDRLAALETWTNSDLFTPSERAALAWSNAVTHVADTGAPDAVYTALFDHFSDQQVVDLTLIVAQMNAWNRVAISFRHEPDA